MVIAINPSATFEYVLKVDRDLPPEEQTVWILRGLTHAERAQVEDSIIQGDSEQRMNYRVGSTRLMSLRFGLVGFRNFRDGDGREINFEMRGGTVHDRVLDRIADEWATELTNAITERGSIKEKDSD